MASVEYTYEGVAHPIEVKKSISLIDEGAVVDLVVTTVISSDVSGELVYSPYFYTYAFYANILKFYTDYDGSGLGVDEIYRLINESDIVQVVEAAISLIQYTSIRSAIESKLAYHMKLQISEVGARSPMDGLINDLRDLVGKWDKKLQKAFKPRMVSTVLKNLSQMKVADQSLQDAVVSAFTSGMEKEHDVSESR